MKKFSMLFLAAAVALVGAIVAPSKAEAVPAFARQVGVPCYSCHFQHIPKLNAFGREFKLGGFTQSAQDLIQDEGLSIPPVLNASMLMKYRYQMGTEDGAKADDGSKIGINRGEFQIYDEAAILAGGRVAENMGTLIEFGAGVLSSKFVFSKDFGGVRGGVVAFQTDGLGVGYGMELFNTGAQRNIRGFEERSFMANQNGTAATGAAEGLLFFGGSDLFVATVGLWGPANGVVDTGLDLSMYYRIAVTPKLGDGLDLMIGVQGVAGETKVSTIAGAAAADANSNGNADAVATVKTDTMALDAQLQTTVGGMSLEAIFVYQTVKAATAFNSNPNDRKNMHLSAELGMGHGGFKLGYGVLDNGKASKGEQTVMVLGGWIAPAQNVDLVLEYAAYSGDAKSRDSRMTAMLEFAF